VNSTFTKRIKGVGHKESEALLGYLLDHIANRPEFHVRFKWEPGSVAFWDNRCTQHYAVADYYPRHRLMQRVTIAGDRPQGP
jgi:taurine dioxygenase